MHAVELQSSRPEASRLCGRLCIPPHGYAALTTCVPFSPAVARYETQSTQPACKILGCKSEDKFLPNSAGWSIYKRVDSSASTPPAPSDPLAPAEAVRASLGLPFDTSRRLDVHGVDASPRLSR